MIEFAAVFWIFVIVFGIIGLLRGWVREIQVTAAAVLAMFMIEQISPFISETLAARTPADVLVEDPFGILRRLVVLKIAIMLIAVFFGYQGPVVIQFATQNRVQANRARESVQEGLLGLAMGLLNGYIIVGAIWWYIHLANYPFDWMISPITALPDSASAALVRALPLSFLASPWLEILVVVLFLIVIIVLI